MLLGFVGNSSIKLIYTIMKNSSLKTAILAILFCSVLAVSAQSDVSADIVSSASPRTYIGGGFGFNDFGLIGLGVEFPIAGQVLGYVDLGVGAWGGKIGLGGTYYLNSFVSGSSLSAGLSRASGASDAIEVELEVEPFDRKEKVMIKYNAVNTLNLKYAYNLQLGKSGRNKCELSAGYAIGISDNSYTVETPNVKLNETSKSVLGLLEPGGMILGLRFMFGLGK